MWKNKGKGISGFFLAGVGWLRFNGEGVVLEDRLVPVSIGLTPSSPGLHRGHRFPLLHLESGQVC